MRKIFFLLSIACTSVSAASPVPDTTVTQTSPDQQLRFHLRLHDQSILEYRAEYKGREIIRWSPLGLEMRSGTIPSRATRLVSVKRTRVNETFPWLFGENQTIHNLYTQVTLAFQQPDGQVFSITARVFNNNIAFRYELQSGEKKEIVQENTGFNFNQPFTVYRHNTESVITPVLLNELKQASDIPLVLASDHLFISLNEAANTNYTKALIGKGAEDNSLRMQFVKDTVRFRSSFNTPWRTITITEKATALCDNSDLLYKLNDRPDPSKDYSWIKPGKLIRDMTLTTAGALACIDFAQQMNFQYVMFDAGWYGKGYYAEFDHSSDPHHVVPEINMPEVVNHGKAKNIGLILYVNYVGLRRNNMDSLYALYRSWGIKGLKFGFVNGLTQDGISWLMGAVKKAQDYGLLIDVHDNYKPTGISRTFPAWLTQEGVRGNENNPDAFHNTTLPFTRFLSGAADYTFCYRNQNDSFNNTMLSKKLQVSQAQQLALTVIFYSPLQSMLWYGRPADYRKPGQVEFFKYVPTTWEKTVHIAGEIGRYAVVARRNRHTWYIGAAANEIYSATIPLQFLEKGKTYTAEIYTDGPDGQVVTHSQTVSSASRLAVELGKGGGMAARVVEINN